MIEYYKMKVDNKTFIKKKVLKRLRTREVVGIDWFFCKLGRSIYYIVYIYYSDKLWEKVLKVSEKGLKWLGEKI